MAIEPMNMRMQFQLRSNVGLLVHNSRVILYKEKGIKKCIKLLKKLTAKRLDKLQSKYITKKKPNLEKFTSKMKDDIEMLINSYGTFRKYFEDIINLIKGSEVALDKEEVDSIKKVESLVNNIFEKGKNNGIIFTQKSKDLFIKEYIKYIKKLEKDAFKNFKNVKRLLKKRAPKIGFLKKIMSNKRLVKEELRDARDESNTISYEERIKARIDEELRDGVRQDFLILLLTYMRAVEKTEIDLEDMRRDMLAQLNKIRKEFSEATEKLVEYLELIGNYKEVKGKFDVQAYEKDIQQISGLLEKVEQGEKYNSKFIYKLASHLRAGAPKLEQAIKTSKMMKEQESTRLAA